MFESENPEWRIEAAKRITKRLVDHAVDLLWISESNAVTLYSDVLAKQIPRSYAAHAFNVYRKSMYQIEIVRLCALWDKPSWKLERENIPTVVELIDSPAVLMQLSETARSQYQPITEDDDSGDRTDSDREAINFYRKQRGAEQAEKALNDLNSAIKNARELEKSKRLQAIRVLRNFQLAHNLVSGDREKGAVESIKSSDERIVLDQTLAIITSLYGWVNGVGFSFDASRKIDRKCVEELWLKCTFAIPRDRSRLGESPQQADNVNGADRK